MGQLEASRIRGSLRAKLFGDPRPTTTVGGIEVGEKLESRGPAIRYAGRHPERGAVSVWTCPAPTHHEGSRVAMVEQRIQALGATDQIAAGCDGDTLWVAEPPGGEAPTDWVRGYRHAAGDLARWHAAGHHHGAFSPSEVYERPDRSIGVRLGWAMLVALHGDLRLEEIETTRPFCPPQPTGTAADDVYAWCASCWVAQCGVIPFASHADKLGAVPTPPARANMPRWLITALRCGLDPSPSARPPLVELVRRLDRGTRSARRVGLAIAASMAAAIAIAFLWPRDQTDPSGRGTQAAEDQRQVTAARALLGRGQVEAARVEALTALDHAQSLDDPTYRVQLMLVLARVDAIDRPGSGRAATWLRRARAAAGTDDELVARVDQAEAELRPD